MMWMFFYGLLSGCFWITLLIAFSKERYNKIIPWPSMTILQLLAYSVDNECLEWSNPESRRFFLFQKIFEDWPALSLSQGETQEVTPGTTRTSVEIKFHPLLVVS